MRIFIVMTALLGLSFAGLALTLDEALVMALEQSPRLKAANQTTAAAELRLAASGLRIDPVLQLNAEGVGGDNDGFNDAEYSVMVEQTLQRGGKRALDRAVSTTGIDVAQAARDQQSLQLQNEVRLAFIDVLAQQKIVAVRAEQEQLGHAFVKAARQRFDAGSGSELEFVQAELALDEILLLQTCSFSDLEAARIALASLLNIAEPELDEVEGAYSELEEVYAQQLAETHPVLMQLSAQEEQALALAAQKRAEDRADVTLQAGVRYDAAEEANSFIVGASIPLNFSRRGRATEAAELAQATALALDRVEAQRVLQQELSSLVAVYGGAKKEADLIADNLIPKANKVYELSQEGYESGRFSWIELIRAQQNLADIRIRQIESLRAAHIARAEIEKYMNEDF